MPQPKPKKVGRPKLPKGDAKGRIVPIRFNATDLKRIESAARASHKTVSEWVRGLVAAKLASVVAIIFCMTLSSCAALRLQTLHDKKAKTIWLSKVSNAASLNTLSRLNDGKATADAGSQFVRVETGVQVYITEETKKHCSGMAVFKKVQVKEGPNKGLEGWICGAYTTNRKVWVL